MSKQAMSHQQVDNATRRALDLIVPPLDVDNRRNWQKALADAESGETFAPHFRIMLPRSRRLRIAIVVAIILIAILIPAIAIGNDLFSPQGPPVPPMGKPMTPRFTLASGSINGEKWQLDAYMTQNMGLCVELAGGLCGGRVIGEPPELYPSDQPPRREMAGGVDMAGNLAAAQGIVAKDVKSVTIHLRNGTELEATLIPAPAGLGADVSIFYKVLAPAEAEQADTLIARGADGGVIAEWAFKPIKVPQPQPLQGVLVASGARDGHPWKLGAYLAKEFPGICLDFTIDGSDEGFCDTVKGESAVTSANGGLPDSWISIEYPSDSVREIFFGVAAQGVHSVAIILGSGVEIPATIVPAPAQLGRDLSIYSVAYSASQAFELKAIVARDADGKVLEEHPLSPRSEARPPAG